jgi:succinate dehydrogenase/fumarate reductase cytochrome b subunit (b558 family)
VAIAGIETNGASAKPSRTHFVLRRLHSASGVVPLGVFLVEHLITNSRAVYGPESFTRAVGAIQRLPLLGAIEIVGILLPLAFHAIYGVIIATNGRPNVVRYPFVHNWLYLLQRATGALALIFVLVHLWQYRFQKFVHALAWTDFYDRLATDLNRPAIYLLYVTGISATVFHFANGLWLFCNTWGIVTSAKNQRRAAFACIAIGAAVWALGINVVLHFAFRCGGVIPLPAMDPIVCGR